MSGETVKSGHCSTVYTTIESSGHSAIETLIQRCRLIRKRMIHCARNDSVVKCASSVHCVFLRRRPALSPAGTPGEQVGCWRCSREFLDEIRKIIQEVRLDTGTRGFNGV
jgi:hypothetical protein